MSSFRHRALVASALALLIAVNVPRYVNRLGASDYTRAAQSIIVVWIGFFVSSRYWVKGDSRFSRTLVATAAGICIPLLLYHVYDTTSDTARTGNLLLLVGIAFHGYGVLFRSEGLKQPGQ